MAITLLQTPYKFQPAYNPINFVVSSDKTAQDNFKYVLDIYITGVSSPAYIRVKHSADPTTGFAVFDVHREVENFLSQDISTTTYGWQQNTNSYAEYTCKFGEEFGLSSSGTTVYSNLTVDSARYAFNGVMDFLDFQNYNQITRLISGSGVRLWMNNQPSSVNIRSDENAWMHAMTDTSGMIYFADINTYDSTNTLIQNVKVLNSSQAASSDDMKFVRFSTGTRNLNLISAGDIYSGAQPIITASVSYYTVAIAQFNGGTTGSVKTFVISDACTKYSTYRLHFLNKWGGFDSFTFIKLSRKTSSLRRETYKRNIGNLTPVTGAYSYNKYDRQDLVYDTSIKDVVSVFSDWLSEGESTWLDELISSPVVYLDDATHGLVAVNITNSSYEERKAVNDKIFNLQITFEYTYNRKRQRA